MSPAATSLTHINVENIAFSPAVKPPASNKTLFLGGAGVRGLEIQGKFVKFTAIGVYLEDEAVPLLAVKWKGKSAQELTDSVEFFRDIVTGPFEKFIRVTTILPLTGEQYSEKVSENCAAIWKSLGIYTDAEAKAIDKFLEVFKAQTFPPGSSILFTQLPNGSLAIRFSKDGSIPEAENAVIQNKLLSEAVLESIIGKNGVSPATRETMATRLTELFEKNAEINGTNHKLSTISPAVTSVSQIEVETVAFPPAVKPPASNKTLFLGGAGARGLEIQGKFVKFTAIGVYLEDEAVPVLAVRWKGKSGKELTDSVEFFRDIVTGPFEKFIRVTMILPLTGQQYSEKVSENCVAIWKSLGIYTDAEAKAIDKFLEIFKAETFPPGSSILFTLLPHGALAITFSKDGSIPEVESTMIENKLLSEAVLESIIGKHGVSPATRETMATRLAELFI
ncbi:hypothetical protein P3X46_014162 [Hevea brasiliensis]|uniref:Chalcone-flavonone isomerase family protein n=1 Tax=Hevea brasiliensis TaxID=3981 RepID=A0ABQ9M5R6_HEVBR|nr:chalcone--flavanone isomerase 2 [Hevea brasiliensis]KAJ9175621.1 hypothetical protein P3X46_014162 [Hevea brasiliensis]